MMYSVEEVSSKVDVSCAEGSKILYEFHMIIAARISLISQQQGKGLSVYVSKFAMPALLFKSMCELKFAGKSVNSNYQRMFDV